ncbi:hypothetical protein [Citreimonas sp.]|uniref:hypothetical protein n=1 Tax=Citreimonas sp. TaxID=3036715 RepID=UPI0040593EF3
MRNSRLQFLIEAQDRTGRAFSALRDKLAVSERRLDRLRSGFTVTAAAATAFATAIGAVARSAIMSANETERFARVANAAPETFQRWAAASKSVGIEQDKLADILKDTNDRVGDFLATGGGEMADFFENIAPKVGVTAEQFARLSGPQALQLYVDSLQKAGVSQGEMVFYLEAMANDVTMLLPLLQNGGAEMERLGQRAEEFGAVMDGKTLMSISRVQVAMNEVGLVFKGAAYQLARELAPSIERMANAFTNSAREGGVLRRVIDTLTENVERLITYAGTATAAIGTAFVGALVAARLAAIGLRGALIRTGIGALIVAAGEMVYQFGRLVAAAGGFGEAMNALANVARDVWRSIGDGGRGLYHVLSGAAKGIAAAFIDAFAWIGEKWDGVVNGMAGPFNRLMDSMGLAARIGASNIGGSLSGIADEWRASGVASIKEGGDLISGAVDGAKESIARLRDLMAGTADETDGAAGAADRLNGALDRIAGGGGDGKKGGKGSADKVKDAMKAVQDATKNAADVMAKRVERIKGYFDQIGGAMSQAIVNGQSMAESLGNAFKQIAADLISSRISSLLTQLAGRLGVFGGGPIAQSVWTPSSPSFFGGGYTGSGSRSGGVDGKGGFPAILHPNETVIDHTKGGGGAQRVEIVVKGGNLVLSDGGQIMAEMQVMAVQAGQAAEAKIRADVRDGRGLAKDLRQTTTARQRLATR